MKILSWNCRGLGNPKTVRALKKLLTNHTPDLVFLMETKLFNSNFSFLSHFLDTYSVNSINCSISGGGGKLEALPSYGIILILLWILWILTLITLMFLYLHTLTLKSGVPLVSMAIHNNKIST
jgi:hypothetical protein